jgi:hypothetical protein
MLMPRFCRLLEKKFTPGKEEGCIRMIKVVAADKSPKKKKHPLGEDSSLSKYEIHKSRSDPDLAIHSEKWGDDAVLNASIYVKHTPLYCIDFDTKDMKTTELFDSLVEGGCYYTETLKGYHFWVMINNIPGEYDNEVDLASLEYFNSVKDIDLIKRKRNVWEPNDRQVNGTCFGELDWNEFKVYVQPELMNFNVPDGVVPAFLASSDEEASPNQEVVVDVENNTPICDVDTMKMYLDRLSQHRVDNYDSWVIISLIIHHNFRNNPIDGYQVYDEWSRKGESYNKKECRKYWDGFKKIDYKRQKASYKKIRGMAEEDNPTNEFEMLYRDKSEEAMVKYMNETIIYKKDSSQIITIESDQCLDFYIKDVSKVIYDYENKDFFVSAPTKKDPKKVKVANPYHLWRKSKFKREVKRIDFDPSPNAPSNIYNLWVGYYLKKESTKDTGFADNLVNHIKRIWCSDDEIAFEYVMNWFAWIIQRPHKKIGIMLSLKSKQGAGKGIVLGIIQEVMDGPDNVNNSGYFSQVSNMESILGQYTYGIEAKCLIDLDEAYWGGNKKVEGQVKNLITETNQEIRKKYGHPYWIHNTTAFITTTNNDLFAGMTEDDRRNMCCQCADHIIQEMSADEKEEYFNSISHSKRGDKYHPEVVSSFAHILYHRDISNFNPQKYPKTALAQDQIQYNWTSITRFWFEVLDEMEWGDIDNHILRWGEDPHDTEIAQGGGTHLDDDGLVVKNDLYYDKNWIYQMYYKKNMGGYSSHKEHKDVFFKKTIEMFGSAWVDKRIAVSKGSSTKNHYIFSQPIDVMRNAFRTYQKYEGKLWSDEGVPTIELPTNGG